MAKFRKRPIVVDAEQFRAADVFPEGERVPTYIDTLEGRMLVSDGDWIITGVKGEKYPCKPDIFKATYEPVEESA